MEEMCAIIMLYYVDDDHVWEEFIFDTPGPPRYSWRLDKDVPVLPHDIDVAASLPDTANASKSGLHV